MSKERVYFLDPEFEARLSEYKRLTPISPPREDSFAGMGMVGGDPVREATALVSIGVCACGM